MVNVNIVLLKMHHLQGFGRISLRISHFKEFYRWCSTASKTPTKPITYTSLTYRRKLLETLAEKKKLLGIEDPPEVKNVVQVEESTAEWKFVERLIPPLTVPFIKCTNELKPSGWKPPAEIPLDLPYYVRRQRLQEPPVYLEITNGQTRHITLVKNVEGDIWAFGNDLKKHLETVSGQKLVRIQVNEVANFVRFKGDHVEEVKRWLMAHGF